MYIQPDTNIRILRNIPLDATYNHTLWWSSVEEQSAYFSSMAKYTLTHQTYARVQKSVLRIGIQAEQLYDCNYLMFQNAAFGNRWFYAFIKGVEYVNNGMSEITFELDVLQTWFFDYNLGQCFVEREHAESDRIGENTVPENLETGAYIVTSENNLLVEELGVYLLTTELIDEVAVFPWHEPSTIGGFPQSCYMLSLSRMTSQTYVILKGIIDAYAKEGKSDAIVAIFTAPYNMVSTQEGVREQTLNGAPRTLSYEPKNSKLFTYPYCALSVTALGQSAELRYELFDGSPEFKVRGGFGVNMEVMCTPQHYAGVDDNLEYCVTLKGFPVCAWTTDYFQNWLAQNKASIITGTISSIAGSALGVAASSVNLNALGAATSIASGVSQIANKVAMVYENSIVPDNMIGSANAADIMCVSGKSGFYTKCKTIRPEYAKIIDDYFSMFGYATHRVKTPNRNSRPQWNYVKTDGCVILGSLPSDDESTICKIYDSGITFWKHPENVGNYSLFNGASGVG